MAKLLVQEILTATGGILIRGEKDFAFQNLSIDSRTILPGDLFLPLKGKRFDGHSFISEAKAKGAKGVIFAEETKEELAVMIKVPDTKRALLQIAQHWRKRFSPKVVAITGSNGKTTVKEMVAHIAQKKYKVLKAKESYNNEIGVPLTLLQLTEEIEVLVLEMEMNEIGGIRLLCEISQPEIGVVTNISDTHLEFLKNREGVAKEKRELLESLPENGIAVLNGDDPLVQKMGKEFPLSKITFGLSPDNDYFPQEVRFSPASTQYLLQGKYPVTLHLIGEGNLYNSLAALATTSALGIDPPTAITALADFQPPPLRYQRINLSSCKILLDCYNANPASMAEALKTLKMIAPSRKVGILGDMKELGEKTEEFHYQLGKMASGYLDILIAVGEWREVVIKGARDNGMSADQTFAREEKEEVIPLLLSLLKPGDTILIKGSRAMGMEKIYEELKSRLTP
jgi:UDP-N-acetylmuramoyl-tripeptide--D-alanyl-D-alanine ligase